MAEPARNDADVEQPLRELIREQGSVVVALSGGLDSSVVAVIAHQELGAQAVAVTGVSASLSANEATSAREVCEQFGLAHLEVTTRELEVEAYAQNDPDRCYHCKTELFRRLSVVKEQRVAGRVLDGTTRDDLDGHRPGHRAAQELDVLSPLCEVGANKSDVHALAHRLGIRAPDRPSSPCLSSRVAYGVRVTSERLRRIGASESYLRSLGFTDVRVRLHDSIARVEVPRAELALAVEHAEAISERLREAGFTYVTLDLRGLRSGSLLEVVQDPR